MYKRPMMIFSLFLVMLLITNIPVKDEPVFFMDEDLPGNAIRELDLHLSQEDLAISFLELESGEATLIQDSQGENVLINTGSELSAAQFKRQMKIFQVDRIDTLIQTNIGKQFTGNLPWLLENIEIGRIMVAGIVAEDFIERYRIPEGVVKPLEAGEGDELLNKISLSVKYIEERQGKGKGDMALNLQYGVHHFLYMGVANGAADKAIIVDGSLDTELIKVAGFGHYFGTSDALLDHVKPEVAVIFKKEGYRASEEVLSRLEERWTEILKPNEQGIVMVKTNKNQYEITQIPLIKPKVVYK
ncbi:ComEC/Rec2 family competence protein [Bacillus sp. Marseille-Q3570]|uniref:ComEC/Rec2 family competence protein n=1 Tax=Bacillus sp. Marseille-Q3570 TaxID=2963522 RepID=UPI0021B72209|nr:hypothetical protein [Bacillus sp. Marseille-Q3570]